jgi:hypothetical protein
VTKVINFISGALESSLGLVFYFGFGSFSLLIEMFGANALNFKTRTRFHPARLSLSMIVLTNLVTLKGAAEMELSLNKQP